MGLFVALVKIVCYVSVKGSDQGGLVGSIVG